MQTEQKTITMNDDSRASLPGGVTIQYSRYFRCFPGPLSIMLLVALLFLALAATGHWLFAIGTALTAALIGLYFIRLREHFQHGCVNPAVVVSHSPCLIAVCSDLTKSSQWSYPVIKILPHPLQATRNRVPPVGTKIPTVALYTNMEPEKPHWSDFNPIAVSCATDISAALLRSMSRLSEEDWQDLEEGLSQVPRPYKPGLYPVHLTPKKG